MTLLLGICNPLLDVVASVPRSLLEENELPLGGAVLANEKQMQLFETVPKEYSCTYLPGGCGQNTIRVFQALSKPNSSMFMGCIGTDKEGALLKNLMSQMGIETLYKEFPSKPTGKCLVLVNESDKDRCVCTSLGAAEDIDLEHAKSLSSQVDRAGAIYCTGFLLSSSKELLLHLSAQCRATSRLFSCNLSAEFLMDAFPEEYVQMLRDSNFTFGNQREFTKLAQVLHLKPGTGSEAGVACEQVKSDGSIVPSSLWDSAGGLALSVLEFACVGEGASDLKKPRMVVMTRGSQSVIVASRDSEGTFCVSAFPVEFVEASKVVDLNGAGDAFVGGFLFGALNGKSVEESVKLAAWCSAYVIQRSGFQFEASECPFKES